MEIIMKLPRTFLRSALLLCVLLSPSLTAYGQQRQSQPPELKELEDAYQHLSQGPRLLAELRRIKAAYPNSPASGIIDAALLETATIVNSNLSKLLTAQREIINSSKAENRFGLYVAAATHLVNSQNTAKFPKPALLEAIHEYKSSGLKLLDDPEFANAAPPAQRSAIIESSKNLFELPLAKALLMSGNIDAAENVVEEYEKNGDHSGFYYKTLGEIRFAQKRDKEALDAFCAAAAEGDDDAKDKAQAIYAKLNGNKAGYDDLLDQFRARLPFEPAPFVEPANWSGKTVLAELFTGSECPPCVGADFAFDGLIESYPSKYLAILEYHLPIPRPDPMMNPASEKRGKFYNINSTPSVLIEGTKPVQAGGGRRNAKEIFGRFKNTIDPFFAAPPAIAINAKARLEGDIVRVECEFSEILEGAEYSVALVQESQKYRGYNEIVFHKMVVRDIQTLKPASAATVAFNIPESEKASLALLKTAIPALRKRHHEIDRSNLKAVVFVQNPKTKQVYNAFVADVAN
jgi:predicted transcriptional regulator